MKKFYYIFSLLTLMVLVGGCSVQKAIPNCGYDGPPPKTTSYTGQKLALAGSKSDKSDKQNPSEILSKRWNKVKEELQKSKIIQERLDTNYQDFDFYRVSINSDTSLVEKYNEQINTLTKNFSYELDHTKDSTVSTILKDTCKKLLPSQKKCPNCVDDIIGISISYTEPAGCNPARSAATVIFCLEEDVYTFRDYSNSLETQTISISELLKPECSQDLSIQDERVVFPKPIIECLNNKDEINKICSNYIFKNDTLIEDSKEPASEESEQASNNDEEENVVASPEYTKIKLKKAEYLDYDPIYKDFTPKSIHQFLRLTLDDDYFQCALE